MVNDATLQNQIDRLKERLFILEEKVEALRIATGKSFYINTEPTGKYVLKEREDVSTKV